MADLVKHLTRNEAVRTAFSVRSHGGRNQCPYCKNANTDVIVDAVDLEPFSEIYGAEIDKVKVVHCFCCSAVWSVRVTPPAHRLPSEIMVSTVCKQVSGAPTVKAVHMCTRCQIADGIAGALKKRGLSVKRGPESDLAESPRIPTHRYSAPS